MLQESLVEALERPHRLGMIGGDLEEQLAHCASFSSVLAQVGHDHVMQTGVDLGTGGGLPGVALAAYWPLMQWTLVDMRASRATEVERAASRLGVSDRVTVLAIEAQNLGHDAEHREFYDVAVARAFGPPALTAECAAGVVRVGGFFVVSEPPDADPRERWNEGSLTRLGFGAPNFVQDDNRRFAVFHKEQACEDRVPRLPPRPNRGWV